MALTAVYAATVANMPQRDLTKLKILGWVNIVLSTIGTVSVAKAIINRVTS